MTDSSDPDDILFQGGGVFDAPDAPAPRLTPEQENEQDALRGAYRRCFTGGGSPADADKVMKNLYGVCWGAVSTFDPDPRIHAYREGARSVLLHVLKMAGRNVIGQQR